MSREHRLAGDQLDGLASGYGDLTTLRLLRAGQLGKNRLLVAAVARAVADCDLVPAATRLLAEAEAADPAAATTVLLHPQVGAWATRTLAGPPTAGVPYLCALAAAAAIRAGLDVTSTVPSPTGTLVLPTVGAAPGVGAGPCVVRFTDGEISVAGRVATVTSTDPDWWLPRRISTSPTGRPIDIAIEDLDPYRDRYPWPPHRRLGAASVERLTVLVGQAWDWVARHRPAHLAALREFVRSVVPVAGPPDSRPASAVSRTATGSIALSLAGDADIVAELLVHELQHTKLNVLLDLVDLYQPGTAARHHAPWRLDPRPVGALLHGAYAHLGVADVWRARGGDVTAGNVTYRYWLEQTARATRDLIRSGELTAPGARFADTMWATLAGWRGGPAAEPDVDAEVRNAADGVTMRWRLRNVHPDPADVARLAAAWRHAAPCPGQATVSRRVAAALPQPAGPPELRPMLGDPAGYQRRLRHDDTDEAAWVMLMLALRRAGRVDAARALLFWPDVVRAVRRVVDVDPVEIAAWSAVAVPPMDHSEAGSM